MHKTLLNRFLLLTIIWVMILGLASETAYACRFWCMVSSKNQEDLIKSELIEKPASLKNLGNEYPDGWSVGNILNHSTQIYRGMGSSFEDSQFDQAVLNISSQSPKIVFSHLRRASSGCLDGVPNPHPFKRQLGDNPWIFGHNGGMKKDILTNLIGKEYLKKHKPTTCDYDPPHSWIDSELYFIFLLKHISNNEENYSQAILRGMRELYQALEDEKKYLNFFLSNGKTLWVFRKGNSLFYTQGIDDDYTTIVASTIPDESENYWLEVPEDTLLAIESGKEIIFYPLFEGKKDE